MLSCYVDVFSVVYRFSNGSFSIVEKLAADLNMSQRIASSSWSNSMAARVSNAVEGSGLVSGNYSQAFALELSREFIALTGYIYESAETLETHNAILYIGSRLQLAPLMLLVVVLGIYWYDSSLSLRIA